MRKNINVILKIIRKEFYQIRQDKRMLIMSFVAPIMQILLLGYAATTDIKFTTMVVCDMDRTAESRRFVHTFTNSGYFIEKYTVNVPDEADHYIENGKAAAALLIPQGFGADILGREPVRVQMIFDGADANTANILLGYARGIVGSFSREALAKVMLMAGGARTGSVVPEPRVWFNPDLKSSNFMVPGVVALVLMLITMTMTSLGIVREKEIGTLEQLLVTPIKPYQLILGKMIPFTIIGYIDVILVLNVAHFWFGVPLVGSLFLLFGLSGLFILTTLGLGLFVSTLARTQQQAMLIAQFFFFMPFTFLSGFTFPIANMPKVVQYLTYVIPLRYYLEIVRSLFLKGSSLSELWPQALALLTFGVGILTMSVLRFRRRLG